MKRHCMEKCLLQLNRIPSNTCTTNLLNYKTDDSKVKHKISKNSNITSRIYFDRKCDLSYFRVVWEIESR